jgi:hypothetical protein
MTKYLEKIEIMEGVPVRRRKSKCGAIALPCVSACTSFAFAEARAV